MTKPLSCSLVFLAAGEARRMGRPKQLLPVGGQPLLRQVVKACVSPLFSPAIVVLGAKASKVGTCLVDLPVQTVINSTWVEGMGSSIRVGLEHLLAQSPATDGLILALTDQPRLSAMHLERLLEARLQTGRSIAASLQQGRLMPPVFFAARHFPELLALRGDEGARSLLKRYPSDVAQVPMDDLGDLDTLAEYEAFVKNEPAG